MLKNLIVLCTVFLVSLASVPSVLAFGEDVLAHTGQYTFFIKPKPGSHVTYYQKMVPCIKTETVIRPRRIVPTYPVPVPAKGRIPTMISEIPVGHAKGVGPCLECFPRPIQYRSTCNPVGPRFIPVAVNGILPEPVCVDRRIKRPQWFEVREDKIPPDSMNRMNRTNGMNRLGYPSRAVRKVGPRG